MTSLPHARIGAGGSIETIQARTPRRRANVAIIPLLRATGVSRSLIWRSSLATKPLPMAFSSMMRCRRSSRFASKSALLGFSTFFDRRV
jgi:hypothetical protein